MSYSYIFFRSLAIKRTLGVRIAAGYLRNMDISIETAIYLLARRNRRG
jgi:hypothetical protein